MSKLKRYSLLCLGDSYTIGEAVAEADRFASQLQHLMKMERIEIENPVIIAKTGWTTDELLKAIEEGNLTKQFDFVTLLIGVNNQYRGRDVENYKIEFRQLLDTAIGFASGNQKHVFVISIPDWGVTPFGNNDPRGEEKISAEIELFNQANKEISGKGDVNYIDITPESKLAKTDATLLTTDSLHPSVKMYRTWAIKLKERLQEVINKRADNNVSQ